VPGDQRLDAHAGLTSGSGPASAGPNCIAARHRRAAARSSRPSRASARRNRPTTIGAWTCTRPALVASTTALPRAQRDLVAGARELVVRAALLGEPHRSVEHAYPGARPGVEQQHLLVAEVDRPDCRRLRFHLRGSIRFAHASGACRY
jgi:hypothetical protein